MTKRLSNKKDSNRRWAGSEERDSKVKGLIIRTQPSGRVLYYAGYRRPVQDDKTGEWKSKTTRTSLGRADHMTRDEARKAARVALSAARIAVNKGFKGDRVKDHVARVLLNINESVIDIESKAAEQDRCPTVQDYVDKEYGPDLERDRKYAANGRETKRLKFLLSLYKDDGLDFLPMKLNAIDRRKIKAWHSLRSDSVLESTGQKPSVATINRDLASIGGMFTSAIEDGYIAVNPVTALRSRRKGQRKQKVRQIVRYLGSNDSDPHEEQRLLQALIDREARKREKRANANKWAKERGYTPKPEIPDDHYADYLRPLVLLALNTGLRRSELLNLRWRHLHIKKTGNNYKYLRIPGRLTKNGKPNDVPLNTYIVKVLRKWKKQCATIDPDAYVFQGRNGKRINNVRRAWQALLADAGIKDFRFHDMRHHFASQLVMKGEPLNTVRELLNHSDLQMTLRYAHLSPDHKRDSVNKLATDKKKWTI